MILRGLINESIKKDKKNGSNKCKKVVKSLTSMRSCWVNNIDVNNYTGPLYSVPPH